MAIDSTLCTSDDESALENPLAFAALLSPSRRVFTENRTSPTSSTITRKLATDSRSNIITRQEPPSDSVDSTRNLVRKPNYKQRKRFVRELDIIPSKIDVEPVDLNTGYSNLKSYSPFHESESFATNNEYTTKYQKEYKATSQSKTEFGKLNSRDFRLRQSVGRLGLNKHENIAEIEKRILSLNTGEKIQFEMESSFERLLVHSISRFHNVKSYSVDHPSTKSRLTFCEIRESGKGCDRSKVVKAKETYLHEKGQRV